jgi:hypothetical protein
MKPQRLAVALTAGNLVLLLALLFRCESAAAQLVTPVLRARMFELVDERGTAAASRS